MSRVGKSPVALPKGVEVTLGADAVSVKGPRGTLSHPLDSGVSVRQEGDELLVEVTNDSQRAKAMSGTMRSLIANMVQGVSEGFERKLQLVGVGFRAQAQGNKLNLSLGFSHPIVHTMPDGIQVETPSPTEVLIKGIDKQAVGQVAADVRGYRPPEPYKGKGVRYADEQVVIKETKKK